MYNKNTVAAALALMAMIGFLIIFVVLGFLAVPPGNKDFFNMGFIALIGFVGTAFGYYLGSSQSSAQKNELLAKPAFAISPPATPPQPDSAAAAGFAVTRLLTVLAFSSLFALCLFSAGCATIGAKQETPQSIAAKSLLSARQGIIAAGTTAADLCSSGQLGLIDCNHAERLYDQAQPAYTAASDAFLLYLTTGDSTGQKETMAKLLALFEEFNGLVSRQGGVH